MPRREFFLVTYEIVTPESAEIGDASERGYIQAGNWQHALESVDMSRDKSALRMDLATALNHIAACEDSGRWLSGVSAYSENHRTGAQETRALHPPKNITTASYGRLKRALKARGYLVGN